MGGKRTCSVGRPAVLWDEILCRSRGEGHRAVGKTPRFGTDWVTNSALASSEPPTNGGSSTSNSRVPQKWGLTPKMWPPKKTLGMMGVSPCWKFTSGCVTPKKKVHPVSEWSYGDPCCSPFGLGIFLVVDRGVERPKDPAIMNIKRVHKTNWARVARAGRMEFARWYGQTHDLFIFNMLRSELSFFKHCMY